MIKIIFLTVLLYHFNFILGQSKQTYLQQNVNYQIDVDLNSEAHQMVGKEFIQYTNHFPDTIRQLFVHLYWNAFQPESMMDVRSRELGKETPFGKPDWDNRVQDRILKLSPEKQGYIKINTLKINGVIHSVQQFETIAKIPLIKPLLPYSTVHIEIDFISQVPEQIRRSGRYNREGVAYSMSQWYPKLCAYDETGWHPNPYIAREFYGEWGDFKVNIQIERQFKLAGSGIKVNNNHSFSLPKRKNTTLWSFQASNVHDFVWAADSEFVEKTIVINAKKPIEIAVVYKKTTHEQDKKWEQLLSVANRAYPFIEKMFGAYPYSKYSFIQGGDGGMEYPNATLIKSSSESTAIHEWMHSWYQMMLASNESLYPWMDEGFTSWAANEVSIYLHPEKAKSRLDYYGSYYIIAKKGIEEAASTHADHFSTNVAYYISSYVKGAIFLEQLAYIIGKPQLDKTLLAYYNQWKFKHPNPDRFLRVAEQVSGLQLNWYKEYWIQSTKTIDYEVASVKENSTNQWVITLIRSGAMPMPIDITILFEDGSKRIYNIPLYMMFGHKKNDMNNTPFTYLPEWKWTHPSYTFEVNKKVRKVEIDSSQRLADIERSNNIWVP